MILRSPGLKDGGILPVATMIRMQLSGWDPSEIRCYRLAGRRLCVDRELPLLAPLRFQQKYQPLPPLPPTYGKLTSPTPVFRGWREIGDRPYWIEVDFGAEGCRCSLSGDWTFEIYRAGVFVRLAESAKLRDVPTEILLAPVLSLALALQDCFCLHTSALQTPKGAVLLAGPTNSGKTTLAEALGGDHDSPFVRIADDVLPVRSSRRGIRALPHFPQPRLPARAQYPLVADEEVPVVGVLVLSGAPALAEPEFVRMGPAEASAGIAVNTVTLGLFDRRLLARHLQFAADLAGAVPFWRVTYPHRREAIAQVAQHLADSC